MKPITNNQLTKIKQIEKQLGINLDTDNMSEFEAHQIIISNKKFHSHLPNETTGCREKEVKADEYQLDSDNGFSGDIIIKKVNLTEQEKRLYDY